MKGYEKLLVIQSRLKAPKDKKNTFGNYTYRSCESILEAVKPLLSETKTVLTLSDRIDVLEGRFYVMATASIYDAETGDLIQDAVAYRREADSKKGMDEAQVTGSASSYARKYALNGLLAIDDNKDPDTDEYAKQTTGKGKRKATEPQEQAEQTEYRCSVCGKEISQKWYEQSVAKYGRAYCSSECKDKGEADR